MNGNPYTHHQKSKYNHNKITSQDSNRSKYLQKKKFEIHRSGHVISSSVELIQIVLASIISPDCLSTVVIVQL